MVGRLVRARSPDASEATPVSSLSESTELDKAAFKEILGKIDQGLRALPATAQVGRHLGVHDLGLGQPRILTPYYISQCIDIYTSNPITQYVSVRQGNQSLVALLNVRF